VKKAILVAVTGTLLAAIAVTLAAESPSAPATRPAMNYSQRHRRDYQRQAAAPAPASDTMRIPTPPPMSREFDILLERSLFYHGHFIPPRQSRDETPQERAARLAREQAMQGGRSAYRPEANFVFRGVLTEKLGGTQVLLENISTNRPVMLRIGDVVAMGMGKIVGADFDDLKYQAAGKTTTVHLGDNLLGAPAGEPVSADQSYDNTAATTDSNNGGGNPSTPPLDSSKMAQIIAELKAKRAAEMGH